MRKTLYKRLLHGERARLIFLRIYNTYIYFYLFKNKQKLKLPLLTAEKTKRTTKKKPYRYYNLSIIFKSIKY